jgi:hypothetical protein
MVAVILLVASILLFLAGNWVFGLVDIGVVLYIIAS